MRTTISSGSPWEAEVGYSRAVRVDRHVFVAGTMAADETGAIIGGNDAGAQMMEALRKIERALHEAGASMADVVRTRMYVTDFDRWREIAEVHAACFGAIRPAATMVEVSRLAADEALVEVEVEAIIAET